MRIVFVVGAVALASAAAADPYDPPQPITPEALVPITPEALAQGTECGKLGAAWVKKNPLPKSGDNDSHAVRIFYGSKTNQCWLIKSDTRNEGLKRARHLIDAQTGIETMACFDSPENYSSISSHNPKLDCDYIEKVENGNLVSGFMAVLLPPQPRNGALSSDLQRRTEP
ncbi:MAG: hypothetical protein WCF79_14110 [Rhodomicrobium sp.]